MKPLIFEFKAKVDQDGNFTRPELTPKHITGPEHYNLLQLQMACRRRLKEGAIMPPRRMNVNELPPTVRVKRDGYLTLFALDL